MVLYQGQLVNKWRHTISGVVSSLSGFKSRVIKTTSCVVCLMQYKIVLFLKHELWWENEKFLII